MVQFDTETSTIFTNFDNVSGIYDIGGVEVNEVFQVNLTDVNVSKLTFIITARGNKPWPGAKGPLNITITPPPMTNSRFSPSNESGKVMLENNWSRIEIVASLKDLPLPKKVNVKSIKDYTKEHESDNGIGEWSMYMRIYYHTGWFPMFSWVEWNITINATTYHHITN